MIYIIIGKSSSGKDSLIKEISKNKLTRIVSYTTRPPRVNEVNGVDYNFITQNEMQELKDNNELFDIREYRTLLHGNPMTWVYANKLSTIKNDSIIILDPQGGEAFKNSFKCTVFYIDSSDGVRTNRAKNRKPFCEEEWNRRLLDDEIKFKDVSYDYKIHNYDGADIKVLVHEIENIIEGIK